MGGILDFDAQLFAFSDELRPYFTAFYALDFRVDGPRVTELLAPEWTAIILTAEGEPSNAAMVPAPRARCAPFCFGGPATKAIDIDVTTSKMYGFGIKPAGWARYIDASAHEFTDRIVDGDAYPVLSSFAAVLDIVRDVGEDREETASAINDHLLALPVVNERNATRVLAIQEAVLDGECRDVAEVCERCGIERRALERLTRRYFGFTPKKLLSRQRFLRTLANFMLSPAERWGDVVDAHYVDQAHFVRDFRTFMGMTPTQYARMPHPILAKIAGQRLADIGAAPDTMLEAIAELG